MRRARLGDRTGDVRSLAEFNESGEVTGNIARADVALPPNSGKSFASNWAPGGKSEPERGRLVTDDGTSWDPIVAPWRLDEYIPAFPVPVGATQTTFPVLSAGPVPARMSLLHKVIADAVAEAARPLLLSGDCSTARAAVAGLQRRHSDLAVVWLDAHGDFNTPDISTSGYIGGMAISMLTGRTPELFDDAFGLRPVPEASVVLADARDLDPAERDALTASQVRRVAADPAAITSAFDGLGHTPVYLHVDVDVIDSAQLSGLCFPSSPGPSLTQIEECLAAVCAAADVIGACIACAWLPDRVSDESTREAITRLAMALGADLAWHEHLPPA